MWNWFVAWGWLYVMIIMSVILTVQMIVHWKDWDALTKLGAFTVIVLTFHVWEEWVIPGGFHYIYNIDSPAGLRDRYPMSQITDMITNFGGALIWFVLVQMKKYGRKMSFAVMIFSFFEFIIHMYLAHHSMSVFAAEGIYTGFYAPGLITAVCCWLPLGIAYTVWFVKNKVRSKDVIGGIIILAALSILLVNLPEKALKSRDNPYVFDNAGWYETWVDSGGGITNE
ncbi:MAG: HXXEE domain-containing protein [Anaerovoracaceae bacterium]